MRKPTLKPAALATLALLGGLAASAAADEARRPYIIQLKDEPAASYQGTISGYAATQPAPGQRFQTHGAAVRAYHGYLNSAQNAVIATVPNAPVMHQYANVLNGFSALLTDAEAAQLRASGRVVNVQLDVPRQLDTISTPAFLGLPNGLWAQTANGAALKGEDMVIGIVDGGIWPENPAFFDHVDASGAPVRSGGTLAYGPKPATFTGVCADGAGFVAARDCNNKLISAKAYDAVFVSQKKVLHWTDFAGSPRDSLGNGVTTASGHGGHGDHTASTAAGNAMNPATIGTVMYGPASGVAPRARVAAYKVCWTYVDTTDSSGSRNSCYNGDAVKAIDEAVADGVNAINFSIGGSQTSVNDLVEQAFYRASLAGVFVAASAGNDGPANQVAHISPWLTTVGASTHGRTLSATVTLGNNANYIGVSTNNTPLAQTALIAAEDAGLNGGAAKFCFSDATAAGAAGQALLDPGKVRGKVVICTRGTNDRVDKSLAVKNAGGVGMVLTDNGAGLVADVHSVPTVMVSAADGASIKAYATAGGSPTAALSAFKITTAKAPLMADFSSRGPNKGDGNVLKPDLTAPGVDVIAQVTPPLSEAQHAAIVAGTLTPPPFWASYQGTSMASPHVAGASLLIRQVHPAWSPAAIKSALMTTAYPTLDDGFTGMQKGQLPWAQGAGHIDPNKAVDPGLVYDMGKADYVRYQCLVNRGAVAADCASFGTLDYTYNLNLPSITIASVPNLVTVRRSVTNVGNAVATYTASVSLPGFTPTVSPAALTLQPGETKSFTLKLEATTAVKNAWTYGQLTWSDGTHRVVSPLQAKLGDPITVAAGTQSANTASGSKLFNVATGYGGKMGSIKAGMAEVTLGAPVTLAPKAIDDDGLLALCKAGSATPNVAVYNVNVPAGSLLARFEVRQAETSDAGDDNDMLLLYPNGTNFVYSGAAGTNEVAQVLLPDAGNYRVCVVAYGGKAAMTHRLSSWVLQPSTPPIGKLAVASAATVYAAGTSTAGISWSGLTAGKRYAGAVVFTDNQGNASASSTTALLVTPGDAQAPQTDVADNVSGKHGSMTH